MNDVTKILSAIEDGDRDAIQQLLPIVYDELRALARQQMSRERSDHTLQATALVHEAYVRLVHGPDLRWPCRRYFFAAAAEAMRRILVDKTRKGLAQKHGGGREVFSLDVDPAGAELDSENLLALNDALASLEEIDAEKAALVKLRHFAVLSEDHAAQALGISRATAARRWAYARAWLYPEVLRRQRDAG